MLMMASPSDLKFLSGGYAHKSAFRILVTTAASYSRVLTRDDSLPVVASVAGVSIPKPGCKLQWIESISRPAMSAEVVKRGASVLEGGRSQ